MNNIAAADRAGHRFIVELCFVGTQYEGWQSQPSGKTVQDHLNKAVQTCLGNSSIKTRGCSRTDSGVHAKQTYATFSSFRPVKSANSFLRSMQALLPNDIAVKRLGIPSDAFNIVKSPHKKLYRYQIWNSSSYVDPFLRPFIWHIPWNLDVGAMQKAAHAFVGTHDFTSFAASDGAAVTKTREILSIEMSKMDKMLVFDVEGTGFLKQMVRNLIGTLVEIGEGKRAPNCIPDIIAQEDRTKAGRTAAASGLTLERVHLHKKDLEDIHWM